MNWDAFLGSFKYMLVGMLGIFIVTAIIICCIYLFNFAISKFTEKKDEENKQE